MVQSYAKDFVRQKGNQWKERICPVLFELTRLESFADLGLGFLWAYWMREGVICWLRMGFEVERGTVGDEASDRGQWGRNHEYEKVGKAVRRGRVHGKIPTEYDWLQRGSRREKQSSDDALSGHTGYVHCHHFCCWPQGKSRMQLMME